MCSIKSIFIALFCGAFTLVCGVKPAPNSPQSNNAAVVRQILDLSFKDTNWDLLDQLVAEDVVIHNLGWDNHQVGLACAKSNQQLGQEAFQRIGLEIHELFASDDRVVIAWTWQLVHVGEYLGIPATHKKVSVSGIQMYCFNKEGKICEIWGAFDRLKPVKQIADN